MAHSEHGWFRMRGGGRVTKYGIYNAQSDSFDKSFVGDDAKEQATQYLKAKHPDNPSLGGVKQYSVKRITD